MFEGISPTRCVPWRKLSRGTLLTPLLYGAAKSATCAPGVASFNVATHADAHTLGEALNCTGNGSFNVTWVGRVGISIPLYVHRGVSLNITGPFGSASTLGNDGAAVIDAEGNSEIFSMRGPSSLRLKNVALQGGYSLSDGGAAIAASNQSIIEAVDCAFVGNIAQGVFGDGGAIYADTCEVTLSGSTAFIGNVANGYGGAIHVSNSEVTINGDATFSGNYGNMYGGVIHAMDNSNVTILNHADFEDNVALWGGGVFSLDESRLAIHGRVRFLDNRLKNVGGIIPAPDTGSRAGEDNSVFSGVSTRNGGVFHVRDGSDVVITGSVTFRNNSGELGGGIYCSESSAIAVTGDVDFSSNNAGNGGGIYAWNCSVVMGGTVEFVSNTAGNGGGLFATGLSDVVMNGTVVFQNNSAREYGGGIFGESCGITIAGEAEFSSNTAANGGGTFLEASVVLVKGQVHFEENLASRSGGAMSVYAPQELRITGSTFVSNAAEIGGAIALTSSGEEGTEFHGCTFEKNSAKDGGALYMYTNEWDESVSNCTFRENYAETSGGAMFHTGALTIAQALFVDNQAGEDGTAIFSVGVLYDVLNVTFERNTLECPIGKYGVEVEPVTAQNETSDSCRFELVCAQCSTGCDVPAGISMTSNMIPVCQEVMEGAQAPSRGTTVRSLDIEEGFYRTSARSEDVRECYLEDACVGGSSANSYCAAGYSGPYCTVCNDGYAPGVAHRCLECSRSVKGSAIGLGLVVIVLLVLMGGSFMRGLVEVVEVDGIDVKHETGETERARLPWKHRRARCQAILAQVFPLATIKIVVVVWQIISQFGMIAGSVYPEEYQRFLSYLSLINMDIGFIMSFSCLVATDFYDRLLLSTIGPLFALAILGFTYFVALKRNSGSEMATPVVAHKHMSTALFVVFFIYSSVSFNIFQTFVCDTLDDGVSYLRADYSLTCETSTHSVYKGYAIGMIFVYPVGIPAVLLWWILRNRHDLAVEERDTLMHLQPLHGLWAAYKPSRYYYEIVECVRRVMMTGIAVFVLPGTSAQIAFVLLVAVVFVFVSESLGPFESRVDMGLYRWGNGVIFASMYAALLLKVDVSEEGQDTVSAFVGVLIAANLFMVVTVLVQSVFLLVEWRDALETVQPGGSADASVRDSSSVCLEDEAKGEIDGVRN